MVATRTVQTALKHIGFDHIKVDGDYGQNTHDAVWHFQYGFSFWGLLIDGKAGPKTMQAMQHSVDRGGAVSAHFRFSEFRCKGPASDAGCRRIWVCRDLIHGLERYRGTVGSVGIVSGCRCERHNKRVGGASLSVHKEGLAADIPRVIGRTAMARLGIFSGIGYQGSTGLVQHVDMRHLGRNATRGTTGAPTVWRYSS